MDSPLGENGGRRLRGSKLLLSCGGGTPSWSGRDARDRSTATATRWLVALPLRWSWPLAGGRRLVGRASSATVARHCRSTWQSGTFGRRRDVAIESPQERVSDAEAGPLSLRPSRLLAGCKHARPRAVARVGEAAICRQLPVSRALAAEMTEASGGTTPRSIVGACLKIASRLRSHRSAKQCLHGR